MIAYRLHEKRHRKEMRRRHLRPIRLAERTRRYNALLAGKPVAEPTTAPVPSISPRPKVHIAPKQNIFRRLWRGMTGAA